jgi:hypothetical protein
MIGLMTLRFSFNDFVPGMEISNRIVQMTAIVEL